MGALMRRHRWAATSLGPPETWPQPLRTALRLLLSTGHPMCLWWGPELLCFYNDAYSASIPPERHPGSLGRPGRAAWTEIWPLIGPRIEQVMSGGGVTPHENILVPITRNGRREVVCWSCSYGPIDDRTAPTGVGGVLAVCAETTDQVQAAQRIRADRERLAFLDRLGAETAPLASADAVLGTTTRLVGRHMGVSVCAYADMDEDQDGFTIRGDWAAPGSTSIRGHYRLADFGARAVTNLVAGRPLVIDDTLRELAPHEAAAFQAIGLAATICMPLVKDGRLTALMAIHDKAPRAWTAEELALLREVTDRSWAHVERVGATAELRRSEANYRALFTAAERRAAELQAILESMPDGVYIGGVDGITLANQPALDQLGFATREELNRDIAALACEIRTRDAETGATIAVEDLVFTRALRGERAVQDVLVRHRQSGEERVLRSAGGPVVIDDRVVAAVTVNTDITEQRRAQQALRQSEEQLRLATEASEVGLWDVDPLNDALFWPPRVKAMFGISPDRPVSMADFYAGLHPEDREDTTKAFAAAADPASRALYDTEYRTIGKEDGRVRWVAAKGRGVFDQNGRCTRIIGTAVDITARKAVEERLRELNDTLEQRVAERTAEREALARIVETTGISVQALDLDYQWTAINEAAVADYERIYGVRPEVGASLRELMADSPDEWAAAKAVWDRALRGETYSEVAEWGDAERERRVYEMRFEALRDADGQVTGAFLTGVDITERTRAQAALAEAEEARRRTDALYRAFFESSPEALFVIGVEPDGGFVVEEINPAHETSLGYKAEDIRGRRIDEVLPPSLAEPVQERYRRALTSGQIEQWRETYEPQGVPQHWDSSLVPLRGLDGRIVRLLGSSRNVTQQVTTEDALRQSQKMEAMGQLTGGVAHDFNNLLTPIMAVLDRLRRQGVGGDREQRLIEGAAQSADRARTLVQRLLAFARRQPLQPTAVDVGVLVHGMADLVASTAGPQVRVIVDVAPDLPPARSDANQLEMAILNLAVNARDAMPGGGTLRLKAIREEAQGQDAARLRIRPGSYVCLSVADIGIGMDEATLARAVEPFFSTKGIGKGTGLGLSMVHGFASQLGGALEIRSRPGLGTTVDLWLPESDAAPDVAPPAAASEQEPQRGTVLLVDDDAAVRLSTAELLGELGYQVTEVASAEDALALVEGGASIDLLVTDHLMPGMTGSDLARRLQALRPGLPILIISGYAESEGIEPDLPRLSKPFRRDELDAALSELAKGR